MPRACLAVFVAALLYCLTPLANAQSDQEKTRTQLKQLQRDVARINREISSAKERRSSLQQQLREAEIRLGKLQQQTADNRRAIGAAETELKQLKQRRGTLQQARNEQQEQVMSELRSAWQMGNDAQLKVLLNQQNPHTVSRVMAYYRYFFDARSEMLARYRQTLLQLDALQQEIDQNTLGLQQKQKTLQEQQVKLSKAQATRQTAVASLSSDIKTKDGQLQQMERDRLKLEELLKAIQEAVVNLKVPENFQDFSAARGTMPWPVKGKASNRFGKPRNEGKMKWQGVRIPASAGTPVNAIHHGRVVYADWFRGSGLLLIIDHGDGYMSLYAHNQSLLREVGEWVTAETRIGTVGSSGGQEQPALYFEIRHKGKPTNPARWCRG